MIFLLGFAFLAGVITVLSPCILPVLPVILSGTVGGGKARPWGIITGFILSFTVFILTLSTLVQALGISADVLRWVAAGLILVFGLVLVVPALKDGFQNLMTALTAQKTGTLKKPGSGYWSGLVLGSGLGLVWTPCVGPIMASVTTLAISQAVDAGAVFITLAYSIGTAIPLVLIMLGGRGLLNRFPFFTKHSGGIQRTFGVLMLLTGIALVSGLDRSFQTWLLQTFPSYGSGLTAIENNSLVDQELQKRSAANTSEKAPDARLADLFHPAAAPTWFNTPDGRAPDLAGKVVLIDFWTYSCINCIRTLPYLKSWYDKYKDKGLVIIGVHSPEFAFEQVPGNVQKALSDFGLTYPVMLDNDFGIWNAFSNQYWPASYFFDREGKLRRTHFGEGNYIESESLLRELLGETGPMAEVPPPAALVNGRTPETYLGSARSVEGTWTASGAFTQDPEGLVFGAGGVLEKEFEAAAVYLVLNPVKVDQPVTATVTIDGQPAETPDISHGELTIASNRLYTLLAGKDSRKGRVKIEFHGPAKAYAFTFG